jgi:hypothetical protein
MPRPSTPTIGVSGILGRPVKPGDDSWDETSLRANGSRECAPDDRLSEAIHCHTNKEAGLLRRFAPRNDVKI